MSSCQHPLSAQHRDTVRGVVVCTSCGDILEEQRFELDPLFERAVGAGGGGGRSGKLAGRSTAAGSLRHLGGSLRPTRSADGSLLPVVYNPRATIEQARREMMNLSRSMEIDPVTMEVALGIYTSALRSHVVSGTRSVILRACLYAACRRQRTTHIIYDFAEPNGDSVHSILAHMKVICEGTKTEVPVLDPSVLVQRLAEQMDLGDHTADVVVCALKVLRAMRDDWIACGRRPMGVCTAALLVGCYVFNVPRTPEQVCGMARLTSNTISKRLIEFSATPAAELQSIDDYQPSNATLPPAFTDSSRKSTEEDMGAEMRELSALYYELVAEAKLSTPATEDRCVKWRRFLEKHCELEQQEPSEANLDLRRLSPLDQLKILGLSHTKPIPYETVEQSVKREEEKLTFKVERSASVGDSLAVGLHGHGHGREHSGVLPFDGYPFGGDRILDINDPEQFELAKKHYLELMEHNAEVRGLHEDFDFHDGDDDGGNNNTIGESKVGPGMGREFAPTQNDGVSLQVAPSPSPAPSLGVPWAEHGHHLPIDPHVEEPPPQSRQERDAARVLLENILRDKDRRHALPWEFLVLQEVAEEDTTDLIGYLVLDNEERMRREKVGQAMYKEEWERGRPRTQEEVQQLENHRLAKRRRRQITQPVPVQDALARALRGRGAAVVNFSGLEEIMPGVDSEEDDVAPEEWM